MKQQLWIILFRLSSWLPVIEAPGYYDDSTPWSVLRYHAVGIQQTVRLFLALAIVGRVVSLSKVLSALRAKPCPHCRQPSYRVLSDADRAFAHPSCHHLWQQQVIKRVKDDLLRRQMMDIAMASVKARRLGFSETLTHG
jgi:hypothetical protein